MSDHHSHIDYDLLGRYFSGEADTAERTRVEEWRDASADNRDVFASLKLMWTESSANHFSSEDSSFQPDVQAAWKLVEQQTTQQPVTRRSGRYMIAAAAILLIVTSSVFLLMRSLLPTEHMVEHRANQTEQIKLSDGSEITANASSIIRYSESYGKTNRRVQMKGEAFFEVAPNKQMPFIIEAGGIQVKVVGTSFNVDQKPDSTVVEVETGRVELRQGKQLIVLNPGEKGVFLVREKRLIHRGVGDVINQFWRNRRLSFRKTPLNVVIGVLNESYQVNIALKEPSLGEQPITVRFEDQELSTVLDILTATLNLRYEQSSDREIILYHADD
ncbi:MAG: FecR domain-containing protein [Bacteroidetes bacterium]|nr:FecR domain-containing protein [Bacteroidota bacterium]